MNLTAKLALSQIKINRNRSIMTLIGIVLSSAMLTAVCGFVASAKSTFDKAFAYDYSNENYNVTLAAIGAILGAIIITASVIVVSNAFRVSAAERTRQFGLLKSVGATRKQIASSVLYEGVFLCLIGIPAGIAAGLVIDLISTSIITNLLKSLSEGGTLHVDSEEFLTISFVVTPVMFVVAIVTSFITVLISAWFPARKAAKISAIDAIRSTGEVKLKKKSVSTSKLTQKFFGFEGVLAEKSLKRSRRNFRATIISLTISIVLIIISGSFSTLMKKTTELAFPNIDAAVEAFWASDIKTGEGENAAVEYVSLDAKTAKVITEKLQSYDNAELYGVGGVNRYSVVLSKGTKVTGSLLTVDEAHYERMCKSAKVPLGSALLVNLRRETVDGKKTEYIPHDFSEYAGKSLTFTLAGHEPIEVTINGELTGKDVDNELFLMDMSDLTVIVPECDSAVYNWFVKVDDLEGFNQYANQVLKDFAPEQKGEILVTADSISIADVVNQMNDLVNTIMFFVYGFVGMLTLIAVTNVISTIYTNVSSRSREFAILESAGMTKAGIRKMLNLESVLCSARSLIIGIPIGIIGAYALYRAMGFSLDLPFEFPAIYVARCVLGVFVITWVTMQYSASKLKDRSIIETIRRE